MDIPLKSLKIYSTHNTFIKNQLYGYLTIEPFIHQVELSKHMPVCIELDVSTVDGKIDHVTKYIEKLKENHKYVKLNNTFASKDNFTVENVFKTLKHPELGFNKDNYPIIFSIDIGHFNDNKTETIKNIVNLYNKIFEDDFKFMKHSFEDCTNKKINDLKGKILLRFKSKDSDTTPHINNLINSNSRSSFSFDGSDIKNYINDEAMIRLYPTHNISEKTINKRPSINSIDLEDKYGIVPDSVGSYSFNEKRIEDYKNKIKTYQEQENKVKQNMTQLSQTRKTSIGGGIFKKIRNLKNLKKCNQKEYTNYCKSYSRLSNIILNSIIIDDEQFRNVNFAAFNFFDVVPNQREKLETIFKYFYSKNINDIVSEIENFKDVSEIKNFKEPKICKGLFHQDIIDDYKLDDEKYNNYFEQARNNILSDVNKDLKEIIVNDTITLYSRETHFGIKPENVTKTQTEYKSKLVGGRNKSKKKSKTRKTKKTNKIKKQKKTRKTRKNKKSKKNKLTRKK